MLVETEPGVATFRVSFEYIESTLPSRRTGSAGRRSARRSVMFFRLLGACRQLADLTARAAWMVLRDDGPNRLFHHLDRNSSRNFTPWDVGLQDAEASETRPSRAQAPRRLIEPRRWPSARLRGATQYQISYQMCARTNISLAARIVPIP
jgi:hypothetical protein